jgi:hypothetical protein
MDALMMMIIIITTTATTTTRIFCQQNGVSLRHHHPLGLGPAVLLAPNVSLQPEVNQSSVFGYWRRQA